ncbi:flagellar hook-length control protein FliK [Burkholderia pseudomallei]|uniref:flagellar hook-length control protein FliK n=1 Tax=Burkholderia pseudomallei TaxID=28450 RepID=UPI0005368E48|nr:flagellar hook-length control protein FliK [Burkholderia pseudomallei]KAA8770371.1 flagellar hook-length control protein FliK [Burkholderia pseudomallei]KGW67313.1 flagellar hook-length control FliK family protein [Burkholderia pseudomallei MSHR1357]KKC15668.1 flagellar hook-length control FliK family protein [Burkholderia pseudomallei MSHR1328]ONA04117.1 flagellar hook-length control FliK family protein [Burkholderia pseudomallei]ONB82537.1 flagellar hook-length control FliK family protein
MTGIDTAAAAILASRIDSLLDAIQPAAGGAAAPQVGTSGAPPASAVPRPAASGPPPASAQTALSEVGLTLDAISRYGGAATPAVVGAAPLLPAAPTAVAVAAQAVSLDPLLATPDARAGNPAAAMAPGAQAAQAAPQAALPASPAAALSLALVQAVAQSGLFYESHLAQWLAGQRTTAELAREPQARLASGAEPDAQAGAQPGQMGDALDDALADLLAVRLPLPQGGRDAPAQGAARPPGQPGQPGQPAGGADEGAAASGRAPTNAAVPARSVDAYAALADADGKPGAPSAQTALARAGMPPTGADTPASIAASLHAATLPIVRQQLDLLATDQFRWIGEAWPGARLDWTIEPDEQHGRERPAPDADFPDARGWRTRLTLALPSLGTIDAELVLNGEQLAARLRASEAGAARLAPHGEALRARLQALGLQVSGLSIRAIDGVPDSFDAAAARAAASAYARAAAGGEAVAKDGFGGAAGATGEAGGAGVEHRASSSSSSPVETDDDWEFAQ